MSPKGVRELSTREIEVAKLLVEGNLNSEIASALDVTEKTVKFHITNIFEATGFTKAGKNKDRKFISNFWRTASYHYAGK
jgi:DNA-binding NarL/FixJ family response regulator